MEVNSKVCTKKCASESYETKQLGQQELFCTNDMCDSFYVRLGGAKQCYDDKCPDDYPF